MAGQSTFYDILKIASLWIMLLIIPFTERTLLDVQTYYGLFIGLGFVFVVYGLTIYSIFAFLQHTKRHPVYIWIAFLLWSLFICCILAVFAIEYDLLPHTSDPSLAKRRPLIDYLYFEIMTFTTVGYGDIVPLSVHGKLLAICTALLGATHGVTFLALMLHALTQQPPAKSQE
jgi:voltage-gated potassium channel